MAPGSYIIVGSGVFGASTALYLIRKYPDANITLVDRDHYDAPTRVAASWDWNKVVRADYGDLLYTKLALEAQGLWRTDPIWQPYYHESGVVWISQSAFAQDAVDNFARLGTEADVQVISVEDAREIYDGAFRNADYTGITNVLVNRNSGWAEAKEALQSTIRAAVSLGVKYVTAEVEAVSIRGEGQARRCRGILTADGTLLSADSVVLSTGAFTPKLLINSDPDWTDLHAGERITAAAVTEATAPLGDEQGAALSSMPVSINDNPIDRGFEVGCLPLPKMNAYKLWGQIIFRNTTEEALTKQALSMPPLQPDYAQWDVSDVLKDDVRWGLKSLFGEKHSSLPIENFRICWDAVTPSEDFIISPHTACEGLFVATCGSFHGFKFLPVLGKYVVEMLSGALDPELQKRWAWNRELPATTIYTKLSRVEFKTLVD